MGTLAVTIQRFLSGVVLFFNWIIASFYRNRQLHNARFARIDELASLLSSTLETETSLLLGASHFTHVLRVRPTDTRRELGNLLIVAPTRGGKGLLATSQLLTWEHSVVVNDIKGELFTQTAGYRSTLGPVFVVDPTGVGHRYDPLLGKQTEDEIFSSATHLLFKPDEGEGAIFTQRATVMLTQVLLAARAEGHAPLPYVRQIIRSGLAAAAERLNTISPELATQFLDVEFAQANLSDRFLLSAWGTLSGGSLIDELITTYDTLQGEDCREVLLLIDEAGRTAIPSLSDHATTVVGRGVSLWIAIQSLSQLDAVYGKARAHVLRDNVESQIYYRPSNQETADYLQHCLGRRSEYAHSQTMGEGTHTSQGLSEQGVPLLTAQEIKQLKDEEIIGFHRRLPAFKAKRMDWRRFPILTQRQSIPPAEAFSFT
ncbi:MAG: type IV secretory system conjugative DNA transfer family protein [Acidobacteria bacterium]|nr:type IV secretory system conjugative DNA transfer family protein [Acidobacteriota bacterium]